MIASIRVSALLTSCVCTLFAWTADGSQSAGDTVTPRLPVSRAEVERRLETARIADDHRTLLLMAYTDQVEAMQGVVTKAVDEMTPGARTTARLEALSLSLWERFFAGWGARVREALNGQEEEHVAAWVSRFRRGACLGYMSSWAGVGIELDFERMIADVNEDRLASPDVRRAVDEHFGAIDAAIGHWATTWLPSADAIITAPVGSEIGWIRDVTATRKAISDIVRANETYRTQIAGLLSSDEAEQFSRLCQAAQYPSVFVESPASAACKGLLSMKEMRPELLAAVAAEQLRYHSQDAMLSASIVREHSRWLAQVRRSRDTPHPGAVLAELGAKRNALVHQSCANLRALFPRDAFEHLPPAIRVLLLYGVEDAPASWKPSG